MKKLFMFFALALIMLTSCGNSLNKDTIKQGALPEYNNGELKEIIYTVQAGDTLDYIAEKFIKRNTYGTRNFLEFKESIKEGNSRTFAGRHENYIVAGEKLVIRYFVKKE